MVKPSSIPLLLLLLLAGCATQPQRSAPPPSAAELAASRALQLVGTPYRFGGATPAGFDCSGLVYYTFQQAGMAVPRSTELQYREATAVPLSSARHGDLLFFDIDGGISHVGIYVGDGRFVHAPSTGKTVQLASLDLEYYRRRLARAARFATPSR